VAIVGAGTVYRRSLLICRSIPMRQIWRIQTTDRRPTMLAFCGGIPLSLTLLKQALARPVLTRRPTKSAGEVRGERSTNGRKEGSRMDEHQTFIDRSLGIALSLCDSRLCASICEPFNSTCSYMKNYYEKDNTGIPVHIVFE
jgi:hypothetical protein